MRQVRLRTVHRHFRTHAFRHFGLQLLIGQPQLDGPLLHAAFKVVEGVLVLVHDEDCPGDEEWFTYVQEIKRQGAFLLPEIVLTRGGRPNSLQRKLLTDVLGGRAMKVAVLSDHTMVRGVITAISWFNRDIRAFGAQDLPGAIAYLGLPMAHLGLVRGTIASLQEELTQKAA